MSLDIFDFLHAFAITAVATRRNIKTTVSFDVYMLHSKLVLVTVPPTVTIREVFLYIEVAAVCQRLGSLVNGCPL